MNKQQVSVERLVRDKKIKELNDKNIKATFKILRGENKLAHLNMRLEEEVLTYVNLMDEYYAKTISKTDMQKLAKKYLINIEELIRTIATMNGDWQSVWNEAKMIQLNFSLEGAMDRYHNNPDMKTLAYLESSVLEEVQSLGMDYVAFERARGVAKSRLGGFGKGCYLEKVEYSSTAKATNLLSNV